MQYHHRASKLKQANKSHKTGGHSTKRTIEAANLGRVNAPASSAGSSAGKRSVKSLASAVSDGKANRANHARQLKDTRRNEALVQKRLLGSSHGPPKTVCVVGLGAGADRAGAVAALLSLCEEAWMPADSALWGSPLTLTFPAFRSRITVVVPPRGGEEAPALAADGGAAAPLRFDVTHTLAAARSADILLVVVDMAGGQEAAVDAEGDLFMSCLKATGVPTVLSVVQGLESLPANKLSEARRWAARLISTEFGADAKVVEAEPAPTTAVGAAAGASPVNPAAPRGASLLARAIAAAAPKSLTWRSQRPYLLVQEMEFQAAAGAPPPSAYASGSGVGGAATASEGDTGTLRLCGYLRGRPLNVHQLLSIPGGGVYQIESISAAEDPARGRALQQHGKGAQQQQQQQQPPGVVGLASTSAAVVPLGDKSLATGADASLGAATGSGGTLFVPFPASLGPHWARRIRFSASSVPAGASAAVFAPSSVSSAPHRGGLIPIAAPTTATPGHPILLAVAAEEYRDSLEVLAPRDQDEGMEAEQTWPTEEEEGGAAGAAPRGRRNLPRGVSEYQAAWLPHDDEEEGDEGESGGDEEEGAATEAQAASSSSSRRLGQSSIHATSGDGQWSAAAGAAEEEKQADREAKARAEALGGRDKFKERRRRRRQGGGDEEEEDEEEGEEGEGPRSSTGGAGEGDDDMQDDEEEGEGGGEAGATAARLAASEGRRAGARTAPSSAAAAAANDVEEEGGSGAAAGGPSSSSSRHTSAQQRESARRAAEAADQIMFPDEVDTPYEQLGRERFARYRGLKSFRTSPWDPKESLPPAYARIFQLGRFRTAQGRILGEADLAERAMLTLEGRAVGAAKAAKRGKQAGAPVSAAAGGAGAVADDEEMAGGSVAAAAGEGEEEMAVDAAPGATSSAAAASSSAAAGAAPSLSDVLGPGWVAPSQYVCIALRGVSRGAVERALLPGVPLIPTALLRHENKTSAVAFNIVRYAPYSEPVRSRDHLELHIGSRVIDARPIFSQRASNGDKDRLERYLLPDRWTVATAYAPITFGPAPVLVFRRIPLGEDTPSSASAEHAHASSSPGPTGLYAAPDVLDARRACSAFRLQLVATGVSIGSEPDRVIAKRVVLSGYPVKVKNRTAMVKYMFFNPGDINWFKPLEVYTKHGLVGAIREPVGTHGAMKCLFDRVIKQHDTVCLSLYKRVFPRWGESYAAAAGVEPHEQARREFERAAAEADDEQE